MPSVTSNIELFTIGQREIVEYHFYRPPGVQCVLACGTCAFIGEVNGSTILKHPLKLGGDLTRLELEHKILTIVGRHPHIIGHKGFTEIGLYERAVNGTIFKYLTASDPPAASLQQRLAWCRNCLRQLNMYTQKW